MENDKRLKNENALVSTKESKNLKAKSQERSLVTDINSISNDVNSVLHNTATVLNSFQNLQKSAIELEKIESKTTIDLEKIKQNHATVNNNINNEYSKQKQTLDKAGDAVDKGLETGNLELVKIGLDKMTEVANHNPVENLYNNINNQIEKDFEDDDFIIEI